jgi:V8-like Glu-specific endopeptidase
MGTGQQSPVQLVPAKTEATIRSEMKSQLNVAPQEYGTGGGGGVPYTTSRVNVYNQPTSTFQPYAATGKLYFNIGSDTYVCSASLIKPGILVTAAHCVTNFGSGTYYSNWVWVPGYNNGTAPYGSWSAKSVRVMTAYLNGTDSCTQAGVICANDIALINLLVPNGLPGTQVGWYGYGYDGYGFNTSNQALINQLGYPVALDSGGFMQRTDSQGVINSSYSNNTLWGSLQTGGSSGGPELVNFGRAPILSDGAGFGAEEQHNLVVGVTSWGYVNISSTGSKIQGASPFTSSNILVMINAECAANPGKC